MGVGKKEEEIFSFYLLIDLYISQQNISTLLRNSFANFTTAFVAKNHFQNVFFGN